MTDAPSKSIGRLGRRGGRSARLATRAVSTTSQVTSDLEAKRCGDSSLPHPSPTHPDRTLVIACGAVARELLAAIRLGGFTHMDVAGIPAKLHNRPEKIPGAVRCKIHASRPKYGRIVVLYGDCGTGGMLDRMLAEEGIERIEGAHCYAFFAGLDSFEAMHEAEPATFYLTDYLVRHFEALMIRGLGLDRHPELRNAYFGNYRRIVYLAQLPSDDLDTKAEAAAKRLGLPLEIRRTGLGLLPDFVARRARKGTTAAQGERT